MAEICPALESRRLTLAFAANTLVVIHPSVRQVIVRGEISEIQVIDPGTQVIHLNGDQRADEIPTLPPVGAVG